MQEQHGVKYRLKSLPTTGFLLILFQDHFVKTCLAAPLMCYLVCAQFYLVLVNSFDKPFN